MCLGALSEGQSRIAFLTIYKVWRPPIWIIARPRFWLSRGLPWPLLVAHG